MTLAPFGSLAWAAWPAGTTDPPAPQPVDIREALIALLSDAPAITESCGDRISCGWRRQGETLPAITLEVIDAEPAMTHNGLNGVVEADFELDVFARDFATLAALRRAIDAALNGFQGTVGEVRICRIKRTGESDEPYLEVGTDRRIEHINLQFDVIYLGAFE